MSQAWSSEGKEGDGGKADCQVEKRGGGVQLTTNIHWVVGGIIDLFRFLLLLLGEAECEDVVVDFKQEATDVLKSQILIV